MNFGIRMYVWRGGRPHKASSHVFRRARVQCKGAQGASSWTPMQFGCLLGTHGCTFAGLCNLIASSGPSAKIAISPPSSPPSSASQIAVSALTPY